MSIDMYAQSWAKLKGCEIKQFLGVGQFGKAFLTSSGSVYKITKDSCEALASIRLKNNPNPLFVEIYDVKKIGGDYYLIEQSYTDHNSDADTLFWELSSASDSIGSEDILEMINFHSEEMSTHLGSHLTAVTDQFKLANDHMVSSGVLGDGLDLASDNFSYVDGKVTIFDCRDNGVSQVEAKKIIAEEFPEVFQVNDYQNEFEI